MNGLHRDDPPRWRRRLARRAHRAALALAVMAGTVAPAGAQPQAQPPLVRLRIVGGIAGVDQYLKHEEPFWSRELARRSGGRYDADIVPFDSAGVPGQDMLTLMRLGVVPFGTALLGQVVAQHPLLGAPDLAGLSPDVDTLRRVVGAFRPQMEQRLREDHRLELLAIYIYPAQVIFCTDPLDGLADLAGRRVRVSSPTQADFVGALGATPVSTSFAEIMPVMRSGRANCAVTAAMSGRALGLHEIARAVLAMPVSWGIAVFAANQDAWLALPEDLRALLRSELPRLEAAVWDESARQTGREPGCDVEAECGRGASGAMRAVRPSAADERRRREVFEHHVLPRWVRRCGTECARVWNGTIAGTVGIQAPVSR